MKKYVGCHKGRIGEQSCIYILRVLSYLVFEGAYSLQLAKLGVHVQKHIKLNDLRYLALDINRCFIGV